MANRPRVFARLTLLVLASALAGGAGAAGWPDIQAALQGQRWAQAAQLLQARLEEKPGDALANDRLALAWLHLKQPEKAEQALSRAEALGHAPGVVAYRRAQLLALRGDREGAFAMLTRAVDLGLPPNTRPEADTLLEPLRGDGRFAAFLQRYDVAMRPCAHDARYRALDYWVGTWDVRPRGAAPDTPASENVITRDHGDCVVVEHWRSANGGTGSSFSLFDASRAQWVQTWVDSGGGLHEYHGQPDAQGNLSFVGETPGNPGQPARVPTRLTLYRLGPDSVRQFSESSVDGGKTWTVNYDLVYTRRADAHASR